MPAVLITEELRWLDLVGSHAIPSREAFPTAAREKSVPFQRMITLTTDFGLTEHYVGAMKGVIYSINPIAKVVDITNAVQSFDVLDGAIAVSQAYNCFPKDTVHVVVVDPGVGGPRRAIIATS